MHNTRINFGVWLERLVTAAVVMVACASMYRVYWPEVRDQPSRFSRLQEDANRLRRESATARRGETVSGEDATIDGGLRLLDARMPTNARVFVLDMLGPENFGKMGVYFYLNHYLFPREVAISLGQPATFKLHEANGRAPASIEELKQAGYDFATEVQSGQSVRVVKLRAMPMNAEARPKPMPARDAVIALLLPLAVALAGSRIVRWLFRDLEGVLSAGELLASGLAVGAFFLTQLVLGLRLAGARWEQTIAGLILIWAAIELALRIRRCHGTQLRLSARSLWWLLLAPAGLVMWWQFRLSALLGLQEFDGVAFWAFKAKILHAYTGRELWTWFQNPGLAYAHMDYPLLVPLLHALTYGALGHVNEFVTRFWNQWMLALLAWAVLGAGGFAGKRPWLAGSVATAILLLPMTQEYALKEGATVPMLFYAVLGSMQLAIGLAEQQAGRLRLGLLMMMAGAMVKFEGMILLGLWAVLLMLDRESRRALWPGAFWKCHQTSVDTLPLFHEMEERAGERRSFISAERRSSNAPPLPCPVGSQPHHDLVAPIQGTAARTVVPHCAGERESKRSIRGGTFKIRLLWPPRRFGRAGLLGLAAWLPYVVFRLIGPVPHPESSCVSLLLENARAVFHVLPMTWAATVVRRFVNNDFADWTSPDNQHAIWQGDWTGLPSIADSWTLGAGWVCLLVVVAAWQRGGRIRRAVFRPGLVFLAFAIIVSLFWTAVHSSPMNYAASLSLSDNNLGGRYLYPVLMAWFVAGTILLARSGEERRTEVRGA